jgi:hypothetical protein
MFKILPLIALFSILCFTGVAQKLKKKIHTSGNYKEVYFVDKESGFRNGTYCIFNTHTKDTVATGNYLKSRRVGEWSFRDPESDQLYMVYNYTKNEMPYLNSELVPDSFLVKTTGEYKNRMVERPLLYTGFRDEIKWIVANEIQVPKEIIKSGQAGLSVLKFAVDKSGQLYETQVITGFSPEIEQQVNAIITQLPGKFLPAIVDAQPVESAFFIRVNIGMPGESFEENQLPAYLIHLNVNYEVVQTQKKSLGYSIETISADELKEHGLR